MANLSLLVLAAGMGSRYGGLKQLDPMGPSGETLLDYSVYDALHAGFDRIVFLIRRDIDAEFRAKVGARYDGRVAVDYAYQELTALPGGFTVPEGRTKPWGTAHAVWCARDVVTEPFAAINADDFYGRKSYQLVGDFLKLGNSTGTRFAMAGYHLCNTLSDHGTVARGICNADSAGQLLGIEECTGIERKNDQIQQQDPDGTVRTFAEQAPVSMNFWGLTPAVFPLLESRLVEFLKTNATDAKTECYIPTAIGEMVTRHEATVKVLPTDASWFGVTYRDDKPIVTAALADLHAKGTYPASLWA
ncbi:nucleotidyltransferase [soil metagenome]